ncbi:MAG: hypothetical protein BIFFINMI_00638 [Phycisphaerae bacterium]|nr:hypothetical protein [Phycisphaerae bacterium]
MSGILGAGAGGIDVLDLHYEWGGYYGHPLAGMLGAENIAARCVDVHGQNGDGYGTPGLGGLWASNDATKEILCYQCGYLGTLVFNVGLKKLDSYQCQQWFAWDWQNPAHADLSMCPSLEFVSLAANDRCNGVWLPYPANHVNYVNLNDTRASQFHLDSALWILAAGPVSNGSFYAAHWYDPWNNGPRPDFPSPGDRGTMGTQEGHLLHQLVFVRQQDRLPTPSDNYWQSWEQRGGRDWYLWRWYDSGEQRQLWFVTDYPPTQDYPTLPGPESEYWCLQQPAYQYSPWRSIGSLNYDPNGPALYQPMGTATGDPFDFGFYQSNPNDPPPGRQSAVMLAARGWTLTLEDDNW